MVTAENDFPKTGNDPMYASEYNIMNPKLIGNTVQGPTNVTVGSATAFATNLATINYSGTDTQIHSWMNFRTYIQNRDVDGDALNVQVRVSGAGMNLSATSKSTSTAEVGVWIDHYLTSGAFTASGGNIGSNYNIYLEAKGDANVAIVKNDFVVIGH